MAHQKLQAVRIRYSFCCGYCGISETDAGGELTIDHFHPVSAGGDDSDDNLVYACVRCNTHKGAVVPEIADRAQGLRLLHPLRDNLAEHLREEDATGRLIALTSIGAFHIETLHLNRDALIANRQRRWRDAQTLAQLDQAEATVKEIAGERLRQDAYIFALEEEIRRLTEQRSEDE